MANIGQSPGESKTGRFLEELGKHSPATAAFLRARLEGTAEPPAPPPVTRNPSPPVTRSHAGYTPPRAPQRHRQGPKPSRRAVVQRRRERLRERESSYLHRLEQRIRAHGGHGVGLTLIPIRVWTACAQVVADATGRAARIHLRRLPNRTAAGAILAAALGAEQTEESPAPRARSFADLRTRRIAALGLGLAMLAKHTRRRGPWGACVMGVPRGALAALCRNPYDQRSSAKPAITTLFGTHRPGASAESGQIGYFKALAAAGFAYRQQLPQHEASAYELIGPSGYATNRYWLATDAPHTIDSEDARAAAVALAERARLDAEALTAQLRRERAAGAEAPPAPS